MPTISACFRAALSKPLRESLRQAARVRRDSGEGCQAMVSNRGIRGRNAMTEGAIRRVTWLAEERGTTRGTTAVLQAEASRLDVGVQVLHLLESMGSLWHLAELRGVGCPLVSQFSRGVAEWTSRLTATEPQWVASGCSKLETGDMLTSMASVALGRPCLLCGARRGWSSVDFFERALSVGSGVVQFRILGSAVVAAEATQKSLYR